MQQVLLRVATINRNPYILCRLIVVGVCGEYLAAALVLETFELVVHILPKWPALRTADV